MPKCYCGSEINRFINFNEGYGKYCSTKCSAIDKKNKINSFNFKFTGNIHNDYYILSTDKSFKFIPYYDFIYEYYKEYIENIIKKLKISSIKDKVYCAVNNIKEYPNCKICNKQLKNIKHIYCSKRCNNLDKPYQIAKINKFNYSGNIHNDIIFLLSKTNKISFAITHIYNLYKEIIDQKIFFLDDDSSASERVYCFINNINGQIKCENCNIENVKFKNYKQGYNKFCSNKCSTSHVDTQNAMKKTMLKRYNVEYPLQSKELDQKRKKTLLKNWGVEHMMQNPILVEKLNKRNKYKFKDYKFPSGNVIKIQGYENFGLDILLEQGYKEEQILTNAVDMPEIYYFTEDNKRHRYYCDIFIPFENRLIEIKSEYTYEKEKNLNLLKHKASIDSNYIHEIWIIDGMGKLIYKINPLHYLL